MSQIKNSNSTFPKEDQAIIFYAEDSFKLSDYVKSVGGIVGPRNIISASHIPNKRICVFLAKSELVDQLVSSHPTIQVGTVELRFHKLIAATKRIVISNISPIIPHDVAKNALEDLGLRLASPISFLKAGIPGKEYNHILSFKRQVYVFTTTEKFELQPSTVISYEGIDYRIDLSIDKTEWNSPETKKRRHPDQLSASHSNISNTMPPPGTSVGVQNTAKVIRNRRKSAERFLPEDVKNRIREKYQSNPKGFTIPEDKFIAFLEKIYDCSDPCQEALKLTTSTKSLLSDMKAIRLILENRGVKYRVTRLINKINEHLNSEDSENRTHHTLSQSSLGLSEEENTSEDSEST